MKVNIDDITYDFEEDYHDDNMLRQEFNSLSQKTFGGLNFEKWYENGYWQKKCIPYTLFYQDKAVSSILALIFDVEILGYKRRYIQLSTVMTDYKYRNKGLVKFIMTRVLNEWKNKSDCIYLYANDSVLDFYPKFGFVQADEYQYSMIHNTKNNLEKKNTLNVEKLDINNKSDLNLFLDKCRYGNPYAEIYMGDNYEIVMFHMLIIPGKTVYYLRDFDMVCVAAEGSNELIIYDIYGTNESASNVSLSQIINTICPKGKVSVRLGFTPYDKENFICKLYKEEDTTLFVLNDMDNIFEERKVMMSFLSRA